MVIDLDSSKDISVYRTSTTQNYVSWQKLEAEVDNGVVQFSTDRGGVYVVRTNKNIGECSCFVCVT